MRRILAVAAAMLLLMAPAATATAAPSCGNCDPTEVVVNGDGTVTLSTTEVPNGGCEGSVYPNKYQCNVRVYGASSMFVHYSPTGGPDTVAVTASWDCPCTAQYWVHAGQWHAYSAMSEPFTP